MIEAMKRRFVEIANILVFIGLCCFSNYCLRSSTICIDNGDACELLQAYA